ncbi:LysR substrate-binding domain-containing protein [Serratia fonticola]|uniref:LysR substrate-binding domain-containing protein n=1 Tax=Serratia fonticola TaxID=47917 RepID=UPI00141A163D|nr:LysR substrate-binding domain-containing protein [Serratia fonticola]NXZ90355.1 transcriptional regulator [Serratia fonticola]
MSSQIKDLEGCVGAPLLIRNNRQVSLTRAGEVFLHQAINILELSEQAKQLARKAMEQQVRLIIGFVPCAEVNILPDVLPQLRLRLPASSIELVSIITTQQEDKLLKGEIDVGFMRRPIISNQLNYRVVYREPLVVVMPIDHPLSQESQLEPHHLDGENFISTDPAHSGALHQMVTAYLAEARCKPNIVQAATNILVTMNLVGMGLGLSIVPRYVSHFQSSNVVFRPLPASAPQIELLMAWHRENSSPALAQMIDLVEEQPEV